MRALCLILLVLVVAAPAAAHRLAPSLLEIEERGDGELAVHWKTPLQRPAGSDLAPVLPPECKPTSEPRAERDLASLSVRWSVRCEGGGLVGRTLAVRIAESTASSSGSFV